MSQRRAQAVADALSTRFGIAANRMTARGVASLAPVAANADDAGRARNRRVELVLRRPGAQRPRICSAPAMPGLRAARLAQKGKMSLCSTLLKQLKEMRREAGEPRII